MSDPATKPTHRTITLTDRPPVRILHADWPEIAHADEDSFGGNDYARHQQASAQGELDDHWLRVRQHADGRTLVYGALDAATAWTHNQSRRGGELLPAGADVAAAIKRVGADLELFPSVIDACIAALPAESI